jgi:hypothetical protein
MFRALYRAGGAAMMWLYAASGMEIAPPFVLKKI